MDFILVVVPPAQAERHVEVYRPRSPESDHAEAREEREKARQCQAELTLEREEKKRLGGLMGLLVSKQMNEEGVVTLRFKAFPRLAGEQLATWRPVSYRATSPSMGGNGGQPRTAQVAVQLWLANESAQSWLAAGAELVSESGARWSAMVWQEAPVVPGTEGQRVVVKVEMPEAEARSTFLLELWEEGRTRSVTFGGVSFP